MLILPVRCRILPIPQYFLMLVPNAQAVKSQLTEMRGKHPRKVGGAERSIAWI